jgi:hypothetical protein
MRFFLIDRVIQEEGLYVYNMQNLVSKHITNSIAPVRNRGGSLVYNNLTAIHRLSCILIFLMIFSTFYQTGGGNFLCLVVTSRTGLENFGNYFAP